MSLMIDGWMPSVGSSRMSSLVPSRARGRSRAAAAGRRRGRRRAGAASAAAPGTSRRCARAPASRGGASRGPSRVLLDGEAREDLAPLRHVADAGARALVRRRRRELAVGEPDAAGGGRHEAHQRPQQRRLADAVAAEERRHLARRHLERDVPQDVAAAVVLVEIVTASISAPGRPRSPAGRSAPAPSGLRRARRLRAAP